MAEELLGYGGQHVSDTDESLKSKTGGLFGLNQKARVTKFAYNPNVAKDGEPVREAIEILVQAGDREYKDWVSPITKVFDKNSAEITDKSSPEYIEGHNALLKQQKALVTHYLKALGVTEEAINNTVAQATSFADWAQRLQNLLPGDYTSRPVDLFLEYQWQPSKDADRTFLTLPRNMKGGYFIVPSQPGEWKEVRNDEGLSYVNQQGAVHPFTRNKNYMDSNKAIPQGVNVAPASAAIPQGQQVQPGNGEAKKSTWS